MTFDGALFFDFALFTTLLLLLSVVLLSVLLVARFRVELKDDRSLSRYSTLLL